MRFIVAEDTLAGCNFPGVQHVFHYQNCRLFEIVADITNGMFRVGERKTVLCTLGRADIHKGRKFPVLIKKLIRIVKETAPGTKVILTGPISTAMDVEHTPEKMKHACDYLENHLSAEGNFIFCRLSERFQLQDQGVRDDLVTDQGLTPKCTDLIQNDIIDIFNNCESGWSMWVLLRLVCCKCK